MTCKPAACKKTWGCFGVQAPLLTSSSINLSFLLPANAICKLVDGLASSSSVLTIASSLQFVVWYAAVLSYAETSVVTSQLTQAVSLSL